MTEEKVEEKMEKKCTCDESCECGCQEGKECTCEDDKCNCGCEEEKCNCKEESKCDCEEDCKCKNDKDCTCDKENNCEEEKKKRGKLFSKKKHEDKLKEAYNKISELEDKLIRKDAEVVNYRRRREEEFSRMMKFANEGIIKDLLPVIDNFERALKLSEGNTDPAFMKLNEGYKMVYCGLENIMTKFEVKAIDGANKPFDPVYHNAVILEAKEGMESGMVIEVLQKGYLYKDKVIRPAMVKVSE